jgi:hypothetical protein
MKRVVNQANCITKYIYNHTWVLNLTRKTTKGREELVRLARFAMNFLTL